MVREFVVDMTNRDGRWTSKIGCIDFNEESEDALRAAICSHLTSVVVIVDKKERNVLTTTMRRTWLVRVSEGEDDSECLDCGELKPRT